MEMGYLHVDWSIVTTRMIVSFSMTNGYKLQHLGCQISLVDQGLLPVPIFNHINIYLL